MAPEWVAVPTVGMRRWLALELARIARRLAAGRGRRRGGEHQVQLPRCLAPGRARGRPARGARRPWQADRLVWSVLEVLETARSDDASRTAPTAGARRHLVRAGPEARGPLRPLLGAPPRADPRLAGRPRRRRHRPPARRATTSWQPHLWRLRARPPRRAEPARGDARAAREAALRRARPWNCLPRLAVFGLTTLPGGAGFIELLGAVASGREVHLMLLDPSPATSSRVREAVLAERSPPSRLRTEGPSLVAVAHPLLASWGRPYRERAVLLAEVESASVPEVEELPAEAGVDQGPASPAGAPAERPARGACAYGRLRARRRRPLGPGALLPRPGAPGPGRARRHTAPAGGRPDPVRERHRRPLPRHRPVRASRGGGIRDLRRRSRLRRRDPARRRAFSTASRTARFASRPRCWRRSTRCWRCLAGRFERVGDARVRLPGRRSAGDFASTTRRCR